MSSMRHTSNPSCSIHISQSSRRSRPHVLPQQTSELLASGLFVPTARLIHCWLLQMPPICVFIHSDSIFLWINNFLVCPSVSHSYVAVRLWEKENTALISSVGVFPLTFKLCKLKYTPDGNTSKTSHRSQTKCLRLHRVAFWATGKCLSHEITFVTTFSLVQVTWWT